MYLHAVAIGEAVPSGNFQGEVHTVFDSVVNLRVDGCATLVTLHAAQAGDLPQGIRLKATSLLPMRDCAPGQRAWRIGQIIYLPSAGWQVALGAAQVWQCDWAGAQVDFSAPGVSAAWTAMQEQVSASFLCAAKDEKYAAMARASVASLAHGLAALRESAAGLDGAAVHRTAAALAGLGCGLTPAGDDMLLGFAAGLRACSGTDAGRLAFLETFGRALRAAAQRTNDISRTYLLLAARGKFSSSVMDVLRAVGRGESGDSLASAVNRLLSTGHSSGRDTAAGLLAGLAVWGNRT